MEQDKDQYEYQHIQILMHLYLIKNNILNKIDVHLGTTENSNAIPLFVSKILSVLHNSNPFFCNSFDNNAYASNVGPRPKPTFIKKKTDKIIN
jgi:hypothetical protein